MNAGERYPAVKKAFLAVLDLEPAERAAWLEANCPAEIREEVDELLAGHDAGPDLDTPAWAVVERANGGGAAPTLVPIDARLDEFRIIRRLGAGGMGEVYLAEDLMLKRHVALKVLLPSTRLSEVAVARFRQEAVTVAQLRHPSIVPIHRVGEADGIHYLVMDLIAGPTLADRIHMDGELDPPATADHDWLKQQAGVIAHIGDALDHAHEQDVIHRDVKPSNIMIDADGTPRLTDFGIAKNFRLEGVTVTGQLAGSIEYMSPEQAIVSGTTIDHRTDVYSLGVTLYEALTLRRPFTGDTAEIIRQQVILKPAPPIQTVNPAIDKDLATIVHHAIEKRADDRYPSAAHFAADLRAWRDGRPIMARPPSVWRKGREWTRNHRTRVLAASLLAFVGIATILTALLLAQQRRTTAPFVVTTDTPVDRLEIARADVVTGIFGPADVLGDAPYAGRRPRGLYKVTAIANGAPVADAITFVPGRDDWPRDADEQPIITPTTLGLRIAATSRAGLDDMLPVPAGTLTTPHGPVVIDALWIDRCEVTNAEYRAYLDENPEVPLPYLWAGTAEDARVYDPQMSDRPVIGVTYHEAVAYAAWKGKRLPTAYEWEWAMRQPDLRMVPWTTPPTDLPDVSDADVIRYSPDIPTGLELYRKYVLPAASAPSAQSGLGILHGHSNVSEITASFRFDLGSQFVQRGASYLDRDRAKDLTDDTTHGWDRVSMQRGFRCVSIRSPSTP